MNAYEDCRCYVEHLLSEHKRLHRLLRVAQGAIMPTDSAGQVDTSSDMVQVLHNVREELEHHFAQEEAGGCLDEAVCRCPSLSAEARRIEAEHPRLLEGIDRLIARAKDANGSVERRVAIAHEFEELRAQLDAHEGAENALLRKVFGANMNGAAPIPPLTADV